MVSIPDLLSQLTLEEKISLLAGKNFWETVDIPRLGIPSLKVSDGPNGARGADVSGHGPTAACFPAAVNLAATFNKDLARRIGRALAEETASKGASVLLGPTVNIHRSPRGGRNFESFSEDPLLAGTLAGQVIAGIQDSGDVGACIKHFTSNEIETRRHFVNVNVDQRTLREIYMKPFEIAIKAAKPWAVMTSYSLLNGTHADLHEQTLRTILREQWGFKGMVMSDWGGTNSVAESITAGMDLEMPGPASQRKIDAVKAAIEKGELKTESIDAAAENVLKLIERAGKFSNPEIPAEQTIISAEHSKLIREAGQQGIVLLKNDKNLLPLSKDKLTSVAAVGLAKECLAHGGGSAMVSCHYRRTPYDALQEVLPKSTDLRYAKGAKTFRSFPDLVEDVVDLSGKPGYTISKYNSVDLASKPKSVENIPKGTTALMMEKNPAATIEADFRPKTTGSHHVAINSLGSTKLYINGELVLTQNTCDDPMGVIFGGAQDVTTTYSFEAGKTYRLRLEAISSLADGVEGLDAALSDGMIATRLCFMTQQDYEEDLLSKAVEVAKEADVVLAFVGNTSVWETEGRDQPAMGLPADGSQDRLISEVAKVNPNVVVINSTGSPIAMPWLSEVSAVVQAWFGGQEAGNSMIDVLFGAVNPSGKLPVSFPKADEFSASYGNFPGESNDQVYYKEGVKVGYRHFDDIPDKVLFPFGFGLSYTKFEIGEAKVEQNEGSLKVSTVVKNVGQVDGNEVVQVYISSPVKTVDMPVKELAAFAKVHVKAGGEEKVEIEVDSQKLGYWDEKSNKWVVEKGEYGVLVGNSSANVKEVGKFVVKETWSFEP